MDEHGTTFMPASRGASAFASIGLGFATGVRRLLRRSTLVTAVLAFALALAGGIIERHVTSVGAIDRSLLATFRLVVPLFVFALAVQVTGRHALREAAWPVARYGAARRDVALGIAGALLAAASLSGAILAVVAVLSAHAPAALPLLGDAFTSAWIGALTAAAYAGWFVLGATFFERGRGVWAALVLDFLLGGGAGILAALLPRAHARSMLGGEGPLGLSQPQSSVALLFMAFALPALAALRCRD